MSTTPNTTEKVTFGDIMPPEITGVIAACETIVTTEREGDESAWQVHKAATEAQHVNFAALVKALESLRIAAGFTENVAHSVVLKAAARWYSDDDRPEALKAGSAMASNLATWETYHTDETWERFLAGHAGRLTEEGYLKPKNPTMRTYCAWLLAAFDKATRDAGYVLNEHDRRVGPPRKKEEETVDVDAVSQALRELAPTLPARFVVAEYTLKELKVIAQATAMIVELSTHGVSVSKIKALTVADS